MDAIDAPDLQLRSAIDPITLRALADSIARRGLLQPIRVRRAGDRWHIVAGFRRYLAHELLGRTTIDAIPLTDDPATDLATSLHENLFRENLTPMEEAALVAHLADTEHMSPHAIALALNHSDDWVAGRAALLAYPPDLQAALHAGTVPIGAAPYLASIADQNQLTAALDAARTHGMTMRNAMEWARQYELYKAALATGREPDVPTADLIATQSNYVPCEIHGGVVYWNTTKLVRVCFDCLKAILAAAKAT